MSKQLLTVPISQVRENTVALRPVDPENEDYKGLVESIREQGFMGTVTVREKVDEETGEMFYELIDGLHRLTAAREVGLEEIAVSVEELDDVGVLHAQIMANIHKVETKPVQYSKQLQRILSDLPLLTEAELAKNLGKSPAWIKQRLGINKIENEQVLTLIDEGKITLSNAFALAKLPPEEIPNWVDRAMTQAPDEFVPAVQERCKEIRAAAKKGEKAEETFSPVAHAQKVKDIKDEFESKEVGGELVKKHKLKSAQDGWDMAIAWVLHMDPDSVEAQKVKWETSKAERERKAEERKKQRAQERAAKKEAEAKEAREEADKVAAAQGQ